MNGNIVCNSDLLETSLKTIQSPGKLEYRIYPTEFYFFQGRPGILHPSPYAYIRWNSPVEPERSRPASNDDSSGYPLAKGTTILYIIPSTELIG